jgi:hypothetical protein
VEIIAREEKAKRKKNPEALSSRSLFFLAQSPPEPVFQRVNPCRTSETTSKPEPVFQRVRVERVCTMYPEHLVSSPLFVLVG